jgi:tRNA nucleotidyltransferase (CCA-adding enzyme)
MANSKLNISGNVANILKTAGSAGDRQKVRVFIVGGFVRDLLIGVDNFDIDIVVEGDGLKFAREFAAQIGGTLITHEQFGTAVIRALCKIDVATARSEAYKSPAVYPSVRFGTIKDDLLRRDFTINSIGVSLNKKTFGKIVDYCKGGNDLKKGIIKVLHDKSFMDDPTRIFRAVRFEQRYGFNIEARTHKLITQAVNLGMIGMLKKQRISKEISLILKEKHAKRMLKRLEELTGIKDVSHRQDK